MANKSDDMTSERIKPYLFCKEFNIQPLINTSSATGASKHTRMKLTTGNCLISSIVLLYSSALVTKMPSIKGSIILSSKIKNETEQTQANNIPLNDILLKIFTSNLYLIIKVRKNMVFKTIIVRRLIQAETPLSNALKIITSNATGIIPHTIMYTAIQAITCLTPIAAEPK